MKKIIRFTIFMLCMPIIWGTFFAKNYQLNKKSLKVLERYNNQQSDASQEEQEASQNKNNLNFIDVIVGSHTIGFELEEYLARVISDFSDRYEIKNHVRFYTNPNKLLRSIDSINSLRDCVKAVDTFATKSVIVDKTKNIVYILAIKYALRVGFVSFKARLEDLQKIQKLYNYWVSQKLHQTRYFFKKSPHKWFFGERQEDEINENIAYLENLQNIYYEHLGALASHLYKCDSSVNEQKMYEWIIELINRIDNIWGITPKKNLVISDTQQLVDVLQNEVSRVYNDRKTSQDLIGNVKKSNHFVRNWIRYATLGVGAFCAYRFYKKNPDRVIEFIEKRQASLVESWNVYAVAPIKGLLEKTIWRKSYSEKDYKEKGDNLSSNQSKFLDFMYKDVENMFGSNNQENENSLTLKEKKSTYFQLKSDLLKSEDLYDKQGIGWRFWSDTDNLANASLDYYKKKGKFYAFIANEYLGYTNNLLDSLNKSLDDQALNLNLVLLTPTLITGWGLAKGVKSLYDVITNRNFYQLSKCLKDIGILLEEDNRKFSHHKYGKLLFLTHQLKKEIMRLVSKKNNMRQEMLDDTVRIESRQTSIDEKIATITSMKDHYFTFFRK